MSEEILLQPSFDKLTEKLDNTQEYEDWLIIQEYIDKLREENKQLKEKLKAVGKGLNKVLSKRKKWKDKYYEEQKKNKWLHQRDTYTNIVHSQFQTEKKEKRYYENILNELERWLEEEKQLNGDVTMKISDVSIAFLRKIKELKGE